MLKGKHIILGITGGIAAYKSVSLLRLFVKAGAEVQVVITPSGKEFITPVTLSALSGKPVISEFFTANTGSWNSHVDLGLWADAMVIAPATASTIGKMANGIADNMLVTTYLSSKCPVFIAPAMDLDMYKHPSTHGNLAKLVLYGNIVIEPEEGELASHLIGKGRMEEPEAIFRIIEEYFSKGQPMKGKRANSLSHDSTTVGAPSLPAVAGTRIATLPIGSVLASMLCRLANSRRNSRILPSFFDGRGTLVISSKMPKTNFGSRSVMVIVVYNLKLNALIFEILLNIFFFAL